MKTLFVFGIVVLWPATACLGGDKGEAKGPCDAPKMLVTLQENIRAEIRTLKNHQWAGEYHEGDGLGRNISLTLAPKAGYLLEWRGCLGLYDWDHGAVIWRSGKLCLSSALPNKREGFLQEFPREFIPVAWSDREYLIPPDELVAFCNAVNYGSEPRRSVIGFFLLRHGDEKSVVTGFPAVPAKFKPYLLEHPIDADIVAVGKYRTHPGAPKSKDTPIVLNCGKKQGLLPGMELHVVEPPWAFVSVTITKAEDDRSEGLMPQDKKDKGPQIGWKLSTRRPRHP